MFAAALWIIVNLAIIVISLAGGSALSLDPAWHKPLANIGTFLAQIFGNALYEEIVYRGFLTVQAILLLQRFGKMPAVIGGVLIAQLFFATLHLPTLIAAGVSWDQALAFVPQAFAMGCMLAAIYLLTGNLLLAVAAHALTDSYMLIFSTPLAKASYAEFVYGMLALALVLGSWTVNKRKQKEPMLTSVPSSRA
jgi:membrane protease YdiL (CAAX protease family)